MGLYSLLGEIAIAFLLLRIEFNFYEKTFYLG